MEVNKIYCENCLDTMARMPDGFIDLTVTSPPYDNLRDYNGFEFDWKAVIKELFRVTKDGGVVVWVVGDATINGSETGTSFKQALYAIDCGFNLHDTMIYEKSNFSNPSSNRYHQIFEFMFVFSKNAPPFNAIMDRRNKVVGKRQTSPSRKRNGDLTKHLKEKIVSVNGQRTNIWRYSTGGSSNTKDDIFLHPATFPEQLPKDHIYSWSKENDLVYDPFMGSGTTAKAAHLLKRNWIGSEISQEYVDLANKRLKPYLNQTTLF